MTTETGTTIEILEFGEDGEWFAAKGHHDLQAFLDAADEYVRNSLGYSESLMASWGTEPKHTYYRPVEFDDCRQDVNRDYRDRLPVERLGLAQRLFSSRQGEGWVYPCPVDHVHAEPWTELRA
jgi:hypothetical protein